MNCCPNTARSEIKFIQLSKKVANIRILKLFESKSVFRFKMFFHIIRLISNKSISGSKNVFRIKMFFRIKHFLRLQENMISKDSDGLFSKFHLFRDVFRINTNLSNQIVFFESKCFSILFG